MAVSFLLVRPECVYWLIYESLKEGKDQESIQSSTTPDNGYQWESDNVTIIQLYITNESQEVSPFPASDHKTSTNRHA